MERGECRYRGSNTKMLNPTKWRIFGQFCDCEGPKTTPTYPKLNQPIPRRRKHFRRLMRQPLMRNDDLTMRPQPTLYPSIFPVPKYHVSVGISRAEPAPVGGEADLAGVACDGVSCEAFFAVLAEVVGGVD